MERKDAMRSRFAGATLRVLILCAASARARYAASAASLTLGNYYLIARCGMRSLHSGCALLRESTGTGSGASTKQHVTELAYK
jgi:hypothetical protein